MELINIVNKLMPAGKPSFLEVAKYPTIKTLVQNEGKKAIWKVLIMLVRDFCNGFNVVRNMNEDQMIEAAAMLLEECDNFRLEDYLMMFAAAKRGDLVKIYDRIDLQIISQVMDAYYQKRHLAGIAEQEKGTEQLETMGTQVRQLEMLHPQDSKLVQVNEKFVCQFEAWKDIVKQ